MTGHWLTLVGLGEDGLDGLSAAARAAIANAEFIMGGQRHLDLLGTHPAVRQAWPSPLSDAIPLLIARRGRPTLVLASGDPFYWGIGVTLARHVPAEEILSLPQPSAFALAANRLGWAQQDTICLSLHGRPLELIYPHLQQGAHILALCWDGTTPARLAEALTVRGFGGSRLTVLEAMGGQRERIRIAAAESFALTDIADLTTVAVEAAAGPTARPMPRTALADDAFEHDGQLTKRPVRALTLAALEPCPGQLLWDVGAGSGSIAIEWMRTHPANRAIAIEADSARAARIARNARELGVPGLRVVEGLAPAACEGLPQPDAIFIGGGSSSQALLDAMQAALPLQGRLVVNAVTLEAQAELALRQQRYGGELSAVTIASVAPLGRYRAFRPALPVHQWVFVRQEAGA